MKAVVVEIKNNLASILTDDGCVETRKNKNYKIGQVIHMSSFKKDIIKKLSIAAGSAAAFILLGVGTWAYASPYTYVSVDVNPSIEFSVNRFDRVISFKAVNDDGEEILKEIALDDLENKTINDAIIKTVEAITSAGYFEGDTEGGIVIATSGDDMEKAEELSQELKDDVEQETIENGDKVNVETISVGLERVQEAQKLGVTPGKLNLVEKLQAAAGNNTVINVEEWLNKPVKEIMKATKEYRKMAKVSGEDASLEDQDQDDLDDVTAVEVTESAANEIENDAEEAEDDDDSEIAKDKAEKAREKAKEKAEKAAEQAKKKAEKAEQAKEKADIKSRQNDKDYEDEDADKDDDSDEDDDTIKDTKDNDDRHDYEKDEDEDDDDDDDKDNDNDDDDEDNNHKDSNKNDD